MIADAAEASTYPLGDSRLTQGRNFRIFFFFFLSLFFTDRERERVSVSLGGAEREGDTESEAGSRLQAVSTEPDPGLEFMDHEIMT